MSSFVSSADGVRLAIDVYGPTDAPVILLIHGFCMSRELWIRQVTDPTLINSFRLVCFDNRGHGESDKPEGDSAYTDGARWAGDITSVLDYVGADRAVAVAWSYGGRIINDYIRHCGTTRLAGINFVAAGTLSIPEAIGPGHETMERMYSHDTAIRSAAEVEYIEAGLDGDTDPKLRAALEKSVSATSRQVRQILRERTIDYDDQLAKVDVPTLISHGERDGLSLPVLATRLEQHMPNAKASLYPDDAHAMFLTSPDRFNAELASFAKTQLSAGSSI
ncbi:alpha/beta fold hydrolase [Eilatimonas milleporae]|uniref:Pimeloyl-ACP methyl ester carboxylesterase n=1 Tax=Eilatimonas milleporae TaxID=911205 RepID=A0A3M0CDL3_9PROT|nr:alpha/beta hydrolase [Eilatimonas milleporae]RMB04826.1 pimeloyl-ACP methyl ester carboxylesterase [Eilatimonas milleporae]